MITQFTYFGTTRYLKTEDCVGHLGEHVLRSLSKYLGFSGQSIFVCNNPDGSIREVHDANPSVVRNLVAEFWGDEEKKFYALSAPRSGISLRRVRAS